MNKFLLFLSILLPTVLKAQLTVDYKIIEGGTTADACNSLSLTPQGALLRAAQFLNPSADARFSRIPQNGLGNTNVVFQNTGVDEGIRSVYNHKGKVYNAGHFTGTVNFSNSIFFITNAASPNGKGVFIASMDTSSIPVLSWVQSIIPANATSTITLRDMDTDTAGNFYLIGNMSGTITFTGVAGNKVTAANGDIFFAKYNASGVCQWVKQLQCVNSPGMGNYISGNAIDVADNGTIFIGGRIASSNFDVDPNAGTVGTFGANGDVFIGKYDNSGNYISHLRLNSGTNSNELFDLEIKDGKITATGQYGWSNIDFDNGVGVVTLPDAGFSTNMFVAQYDTSFVFQWVNACSGPTGEYGNRLTIDNNGNVYVLANFTGTVDFNPLATPSRSLSSAGGVDVAILKYNNIGEVQWAKKLGGTGADYGAGIAIDGLGDNLYVTGNFSGTVNFDLEGGTNNATSAGSTDIFMVKYVQTSSPLSASLSPLSGKSMLNSISLYWSSYRENNCDKFIVEQSADGKTFKEIGSVPSKAEQGSSNTKIDYQFYDIAIEAEFFYRVKQIDRDGNFEFTNIVSLSPKNAELTVLLYPNPANTFVLVDNLQQGSTLMVTNAAGRVVYTKQECSNREIIATQNLASGAYMLNIVGKQQKQQLKFAVKK